MAAGEDPASTSWRHDGGEPGLGVPSPSWSNGGGHTCETPPSTGGGAAPTRRCLEADGHRWEDLDAINLAKETEEME